MNRIFGFVLAALILLSALPALARTLTVVTLVSPPLEYMELGKAKGVNVEMAREALRRLGYETKFVFVPWKRALAMVQRGDADAILDAVWTEERSSFLHYPHVNIYLEESYAFKLKSRDITLDEGLGNAGNFVAGVGRGFSYGPLVDEAIRSGLMPAEEAPDMRSNVRKLLHGRIDLFIGVRVPVVHLFKSMGVMDRIDVTLMTGTRTPYRLGVTPTFLAFSKRLHEKEMADKVGQVLGAMKADGTFKRISDEYR